MEPPTRLRNAGVVVLWLGFVSSVPTWAQAKPAVPPRLYGRASFWNTPIPANARVDPNSAAIIAASIAAVRTSSVFAIGDKWGVPAALARPTARAYRVDRTPSFGAPTVWFRVPGGGRP